MRTILTPVSGQKAGRYARNGQTALTPSEAETRMQTQGSVECCSRPTPGKAWVFSLCRPKHLLLQSAIHRSGRVAPSRAIEDSPEPGEAVVSTAFGIGIAIRPKLFGPHAQLGRDRRLNAPGAAIALAHAGHSRPGYAEIACHFCQRTAGDPKPHLDPLVLFQGWAHA